MRSISGVSYLMEGQSAGPRSSANRTAKAKEAKMQLDSDIAGALESLGEVRGQKREAAASLATLLAEAAEQLKEMIAGCALDPVTREPLLALEWSTTDRGVSLSVSALARKYAFFLEVHYELGGMLASAVQCEDDPDNFFKTTFRGTPSRLVKAADGHIDLIRRINDNENAMPITALLGAFIGSVTFRERRTG